MPQTSRLCEELPGTQVLVFSVQSPFGLSCDSYLHSLLAEVTLAPLLCAGSCQNVTNVPHWCVDGLYVVEPCSEMFMFGSPPKDRRVVNTLHQLPYASPSRMSRPPLTLPVCFLDSYMLDLGFSCIALKLPCSTSEHREVFFSRRPTDQRVAQQVCADCPFLTDCQEYLDTGEYGEYGVVAGLTPAQRRRMKKGK